MALLQKRFTTMIMFAKHVVFHFIFDKNDTDIYIYLVFSREKSYTSIFSNELLQIRCLSSQWKQTDGSTLVNLCNVFFFI